MAQLTAPESVVRAILAARPGPSRTRVLAALGLAEDGSPGREEDRATALAELVAGSLDPEDATQTELPEPRETYDDEEVPF